MEVQIRCFHCQCHCWIMACREFVWIGKRRDCQIRVTVNSEDRLKCLKQGYHDGTSVGLVIS
ncbi:hypothetical protein BDW60DRAFT_183882 [Aspergillus nidulans var. acristatus]